MAEQVTTVDDLPEDLPHALASGRAYWYWIGGSPAIDLVNTLRERWRRRVECLVDPDDLVGWLEEAGLISTGSAVVASPGQLTRARRLREAIDSVLRSAVEGAHPDPAAVDVIRDVLRELAPRPGIAVSERAIDLVDVGPADLVDAALGMLAVDAARVLGTRERERVRICAAEDCSARFLDRSPAGRRRWCTMGGCGNRAKVRRHRRRAAGS